MFLTVIYIKYPLGTLASRGDFSYIYTLSAAYIEIKQFSQRLIRDKLSYVNGLFDLVTVLLLCQLAFFGGNEKPELAIGQVEDSAVILGEYRGAVEGEEEIIILERFILRHI